MLRTDEFFNLTVNLEGGFSDRDEDKGGRTKYGITQLTLNYYNKAHLHPDEDVAKITIDKAKNIYLEYYYSPVTPIADKEIHFNFIDMSYNSGHARYVQLRDSIGIPPTITRVYEWREKYYRSLNEISNINGWLNRLIKIKEYFKKSII